MRARVSGACSPNLIGENVRVPEITPFRGVHYDPLRTYGLSPVIGPPEDLPNLEQASRAVEGRPYHSLRLELGDVDRGEWQPPAEVRTTVFERWLHDGILVRDQRPALYIHEHRYRYEGIYHRRMGVFAVADLTDDSVTGFRPHEGTIPENLTYRTKLLQSLRLSISPIFTLIRDGGWLGAVLVETVQGRPPDLSGHDAEEGVHRVWMLDDPDLVRWICDLVGDQPLYIADGHHRFAAAKALREQMLADGQDPGSASRVMTLIVSELDPGVSILPIHREIKRLPGDREAALERLRQTFETECVLKPFQVEPESVRRRVHRLAGSAGERPEFFMLASEDRELVHCRLPDWESAETLLDASIPPEVRGLDVTVMHRIVLERVLGIPAEDPDGLVSYSPDSEAIVKRVLSGESAVGLFMRNPRIEQVMAVADAGAHMPQKSTYFYPKVPAGLVMYDLRPGE